MIECRPFNNSDSPAIARFWQAQSLQGLARPMTPTVLNHVVLGKLYFRSEDFFLAHEGARLCGILHLARDPVSGPQSPSVVNMLLVEPDCEDPAAVADVLLDHASQCGGPPVATAGPLQPGLFYIGLYGGTCFPGLLESDSTVIDALGRYGFQVTHRRGIYRGEASRISYPVDREVRQLRRQSHSTVRVLAPDPDWRTANLLSHLERRIVQLETAPGGELLGRVETWDASPLADGWSGPAARIHRLLPERNENSEVVTRALLAEAITFIQGTATPFLEIHDDLLGGPALQELGFQLVDQAVEMTLDPD